MSTTAEDADRALANMERIRTWQPGEEPEICRGPKPESEHDYRYLGAGIWIRGDIPTTRWKELLDSLPPLAGT